MVDPDRWTPWRISPTRSCARAALGAVLLLAACRTAAPAKPATDDATRIPAAPPVTYVPFAPMVLVAQGEHAFVLLHATVGGVGDGGLSFGAAYVAATDPTAAVADDAPRR